MPRSEQRQCRCEHDPQSVHCCAVCGRAGGLENMGGVGCRVARDRCWWLSTRATAEIAPVSPECRRNCISLVHSAPGILEPLLKLGCGAPHPLRVQGPRDVNPRRFSGRVACESALSAGNWAWQILGYGQRTPKPGSRGRDASYPDNTLRRPTLRPSRPKFRASFNFRSTAHSRFRQELEP